MKRYGLSMSVLALALPLGGFLATAVPAAAAPKVVASIKPVHSLVAGVMQGIGEPTLLIKSGGSPHSYSLRPSEAKALQEADVVFWVGEGIETFLEKPLASLAGGGTVVTLSDAEGIALLAFRDGGAWEAHDHGDHDAHAEGEHDHGGHDHEAHDHEGHDHDEHAHDEHAHDEHAHDEHAHDEHAHDDHDSHEHEGHAHEGHQHGAHDMHVWLDPHNAEAIVRATVAALQQADAANGARYAENGAAVIARLEAMEADLAAKLAPVKEAPYLVFHDAYQYFEAHYGMRAVGSVTVSPERAPGAKRIAELRHKIEDAGAVCVFSEPQFEPALVDTVVEGTAARTGVLDPLGAALSAGPDAYFSLMENLADSLVACLKPTT